MGTGSTEMLVLLKGHETSQYRLFSGDHHRPRVKESKNGRGSTGRCMHHTQKLQKLIETLHRPVTPTDSPVRGRSHPDRYWSFGSLRMCGLLLTSGMVGESNTGVVTLVSESRCRDMTSETWTGLERPIRTVFMESPEVITDRVPTTLDHLCVREDDLDPGEWVSVSKQSTSSPNLVPPNLDDRFKTDET